MTASVRLCAPSFPMMALTWNLTVCSLISSRLAMALLGTPSARTWRTCISRGVSSAEGGAGDRPRAGMTASAQLGSYHDLALSHSRQGGDEARSIRVTHHQATHARAPRFGGMHGVGQQGHDRGHRARQLRYHVQGVAISGDLPNDDASRLLRQDRSQPGPGQWIVGYD